MVFEKAFTGIVLFHHRDKRNLIDCRRSLLSAQWNRKNVISFRENYLQQKLNSATDSTPEAFMPDIPVRFIIDWIGLKQFIIIDYLAGYVLRRAQSVRLSIPAKPP